MNRLTAAIVLAACWCAAPALAREGESPRQGVFEFNGGKYKPSVSDTSAYQTIFGDRALWHFEAEGDYALYHGIGTLSVGLAAGYGSLFGHSLAVIDGQPTSEPTTLKAIPIRAMAVYRFDWLDRRFGIPLVPFGKVGLANTIWWITDSHDNVAKFPNPDDSEDRALGGKWGYTLAGGLALNLNFLDPPLARDFDQDAGVNGTYLQAQYVLVTADNFGGDGLDLSWDAFLFGLAFEF